jgi:hypothetical protein
MTAPTSSDVIARWESRSGKWWVEIEPSSFGGFNYAAADRSLGYLGNIPEIAALREMQKRVDQRLFQPDANKTPMKRTF